VIANPFKMERPMEHLFSVAGMSCGHCERAITKALLQLDPQAQVQIDRAAQEVRVESHQAKDALARAIAAEGYEVQ
jgi:copper chaperone